MSFLQYNTIPHSHIMSKPYAACGLWRWRYWGLGAEGLRVVEDTVFCDEDDCQWWGLACHYRVRSVCLSVCLSVCCFVNMINREDTVMYNVCHIRDTRLSWEMSSFWPQGVMKRRYEWSIAWTLKSLIRNINCLLLISCFMGIRKGPPLTHEEKLLILCSHLEMINWL